MRSLRLVLLALVGFGCSGSRTTPDPADGGPPPVGLADAGSADAGPEDAGPPSYSFHFIISAEAASVIEDHPVATVSAGAASGTLSYVFAIGGGSPENLTIDLRFTPTLTAPDCTWTSPGVRFDRGEAQSDVLGADASEQKAHVHLFKAGDAAVTVTGKLTGVSCTVGGQQVSEVPLQLTLQIKVIAVVGVRLDWGVDDDGAPRLLPSDTPFRIPTVMSLDAAGGAYVPRNQAIPIALSLDSEREVSHVSDTTGTFLQLAGKPGRAVFTEVSASGVALSGTTALRFVGPESLTAAPTFYVSTSSGAASELAEGSTVAGASVGIGFQKPLQTAYGPLHGLPAPGWFTASSSDAAVCAAETATVGVPPVDYRLASVAGAGACTLTVGLAGTSRTFSRRFTVAP